MFFGARCFEALKRFSRERHYSTSSLEAGRQGCCFGVVGQFDVVAASLSRQMAA
jgi:hypothetical protein